MSRLKMQRSEKTLVSNTETVCDHADPGSGHKPEGLFIFYAVRAIRDPCKTGFREL